MKNSIKILLIIFCVLWGNKNLFASVAGTDWPIYKGNLYFTGNNDEIIVKNNNLKWLFQARGRVFNPIVSDGHVYFLDVKGMLYCVEEEYGRLVWKVDVHKISSVFRRLSRSAGKIKYPLIKGNTLFLTDPVAIYALNKRNGKVLWARTAMRMNHAGARDRFSKKALPVVDGIYSNPLLHEDMVIYGTRKMMLSRKMYNGHEKWKNSSIQSYSGFPTFYDRFILTQSMDYGTGIYKIHCLDAGSGNEIWSKRLPKPMKIFPPVVYKGRVFVPVNKGMYSLDLKGGRTLWSREYGGYMTSVPSFTDRAILCTVDNKKLVVIEPENGAVRREIITGKGTSPHFITIRNLVYFAYNGHKEAKNRKMPFGNVKALNFETGKNFWTYKTPFPGGVSQPVASGGILFLPAGNYLYALGTEYYSKNQDGGSGFAVIPPDARRSEKDKPGSDPPERKRVPEKKKDVPTKELKVNIKSKDGSTIPAEIEIKKREKGKLIFNDKERLKGPGTITIPKGKNTELIISSPGHVPKKLVLDGDENEKEIILDPFEKGKGFVVDNILFEFDSAYLKKSSLDILDKFIAMLKRKSDMKVEVRGYTDNIGKKWYNRKLSERRADAVAAYIIKNGISPERISAKGFGEKNPIASNKTKKGRQKNRRTEFFFLK